jgi:hypothetical protein
LSEAAPGRLPARKTMKTKKAIKEFLFMVNFY